ncbi:MAG: hypothetical protein OEV63_06170 [Gammaproteobacteria bacterium]|nr:hypothetical protein [Gammaproteobacteria bacterium]
MHRILLGPQRPVKNLSEIAGNTDLPAGPFAVISAAWQEDEAYTDDVAELVGRPLQNLMLYGRAEKIFAADVKLHAAYRERQERLMALQRLYRARLRQLMIAARHLQRSETDADLLEPEIRHSITQIRALDRHHHHRVEAIHASYSDAISETTSAVLAEHKAEMVEQLAACETLVITGGNVVVLQNRMRLFGMGELIASRHIVAWSAGAMVLGDQVVLFHDHTPQTRRDPEILSAGTGTVPGCVFLPDAKHRLKSGDASRIGLLCRRFAPVKCLTLNSGSMLWFEDAHLRAANDVRRLSRNNGLKRVRTL